jgi:hypothetical protein
LKGEAKYRKSYTIHVNWVKKPLGYREKYFGNVKVTSMGISYFRSVVSGTEVFPDLMTFGDSCGILEPGSTPLYKRV